MQQHLKWLGRPVKEALSSLSETGEKPPILTVTAPPRKAGGTAERQEEGTLRVIACREGQWIAARFRDQRPQEKEDT